MKKTKLLIFASIAGLGGSEKMVYHLARGINRDKFDVTVCFLYGEGIISQRLFEENIDVIILHHDREGFLKTAWKYFNIARQRKFDIVYLWGYKVNIIGRLAGKILGSKIVTAQRSVDDHRTKLQDVVDGFTNWMADLYISNSKAAEEMLINKKKIDRSKVITIHNGIDIERYQTSEGAGKSEFEIEQGILVVGVVANLIPYKGYDYFLRAFQEVCSQVQNVSAVLVGEGEARESLEDMAESLGIKDRVSFLGLRKDVPSILKTFDIFVLPSLFEGLPNSIMEAMASRLPVIATDVGGIPELVINGETGFLVPAKQPPAMAEKILELVGDKEKRRIMGEKGFDRLTKEFSMSSMIEKTEAAFECLLYEGR